MLDDDRLIEWELVRSKAKHGEQNAPAGEFFVVHRAEVPGGWLYAVQATAMGAPTVTLVPRPAVGK